MNFSNHRFHSHHKCNAQTVQQTNTKQAVENSPCRAPGSKFNQIGVCGPISVYLRLLHMGSLLHLVIYFCCLESAEGDLALGRNRNVFIPLCLKMKVRQIEHHSRFNPQLWCLWLGCWDSCQVERQWGMMLLVGAPVEDLQGYCDLYYQLSVAVENACYQKQEWTPQLVCRFERLKCVT